MQAETEKISKTRDFYHAVVLKTLGLPLLGLERGEGEFANFVFEASENEVEATIRDYWEGKVLVDAKELIANIHELKTRLHSGEGWR